MYVGRLQTVTAEEVCNVLKSLPSKTAFGVDGISYLLLREAGPGPQALVSLFNNTIALGCVPGELKIAVISPVFKGGRKDRRPLEIIY